MGDRDKFSNENFGLGRPYVHATSYLKNKAKKFFSQAPCHNIIHEYHILATKVLLKSRIVPQNFSVSNNVSSLKQGTFFHQNIEFFSKNIRSKGQVRYVSWFCLFQQLFAKKRNCMKTRWCNLFGTRNDMKVVRSILQNPRLDQTTKKFDDRISDT